jgi:hypothetical protein
MIAFFSRRDNISGFDLLNESQKQVVRERIIKLKEQAQEKRAEAKLADDRAYASRGRLRAPRHIHAQFTFTMQL